MYGWAIFRSHGGLGCPPSYLSQSNLNKLEPRSSKGCEGELTSSRLREKMHPPEEVYKYLYERMATLCLEMGWGEPFSYARAKEIYAAIELGHTIADTFSGADAFNANNDPVEYKSTTSKSVKGAYTGISVQPTWELQDEYLRNEKIAKYPEHYYNRFEKGKLVESWVMDGNKVYELLRPKLRASYGTALHKKDPRLSATITTSEIKKYGRQVI
tara:strand:+ start:967 stop:1608 length:642 start_codon:yes stop_codon:yes gene_type:complete